MINNMDYELVQELRDAGFPGIIIQREHIQSHPTLEEFIEACGDEFGDLRKHIYNGIVSYSARPWSLGGLYGEGPTPTEAVAKLWLALNKK